MSTRENTVSCWMDFSLPVAPTLDTDVEADVCVVGAGIAGMTTAYLLAGADRSVVVLDAAGIGEGQTQRTTAHLSNAIDDRFQEIERIHGVEGARLAAESHTAAIARIERICQEETLDCDFTRVDGFLFLAPSHSIDLLKREWEACQRARLSGVTLGSGRIGSHGPVDWLHFPNQGQIHPLKYLAGLAKCLVHRGGRIFSRNPVMSIEGGAAAQVKTRDGQRVMCRSVVVATNTPINDLVAIHTKQAPYRTYAIVAGVPAGSVPLALYWDTADPYHYVRIQPGSTASGDLLIVGGEDHKTGQDDPSINHFAALEAWARGCFPQMGPVVHSWSGQVQETIDGLAFIGRNPMDAENVYIATGDSGMGMTHGTIAGILLTELIQGRDHPWVRLYDPSRKPLRSGGTFTLENANVALQYVDWLRGGDVSSASEIAPGQGAVIRRGLHKIAVYRDDAGTLHERSAVCPHLGCVVHWNHVENTWDCPCHGSRFDCFGRVITGPATSDLSMLNADR